MGCTPGAYGSGAWLGNIVAGRLCVKDAGAGSTPFNVQLKTANGEQYWACLNWELVPGAEFSTWQSGVWTIPVNVSTAGSANTVIKDVYVSRVSNACGQLSVMGSLLDTYVGVDSTGVRFLDVTCGAIASPAADDKIIAVVVFADDGAPDTIVGITPDQVIITPLSAGSVPTMRRRRAA